MSSGANAAETMEAGTGGLQPLHLSPFWRNSPRIRIFSVVMAGLLALAASAVQGQAAKPPTASQAAPASQGAAPAGAQAKDARQPKDKDRRRAVKLYLQASKLFEQEKFEEAMDGYRQAAELDPSNANYRLAAELARSHAVTALIQAATKDRLIGDAAGERAALTHALELDPKNAKVTEHLYELGDDAVRGQSKPLYEEAASSIGESVKLLPTYRVHNFHLHTDAAQVIQEVFMSYGLDATVDQSILSTPVRLDLDSATFEEATRVLAMVTNSFYVPLDPHRVLVARDTRENRVQFMRQDLETIYLSGLTEPELTDVVNVAKNVFQMQHVVRDPGAGTITVRAPTSVLTTFNKTLRDLVEGRNQVLLDVRLIQLAHTSDRNTGVQPPQSFSAVNVYAEEQSILTANQALVQQIISSGLAAPGDTLAILGILLASGQISNSLFSNGIALFGGGITQSALSPGKMTANISLNSSDSRELEELQLRLGDGEDGKLTVGERYPIQTSSFSSLSAGTSSIAGLTGAGNSSALSSLLAAANSVPNVPQVEYQDLGLKLKATPRVMRNDEVALTIDLKIDALSGATVNDNPILANRSYEGVVIVKKGEAVVVAGELDKSESRAISGTPGISEIPGLNNLTDKDMQKNYSTLLIIMTPHVIRGTQADGHTPMMRIDKNSLEH